VATLRAANQEKVCVHKALLGDEVTGVGPCKWSCFPRTTVKSFVEYLYQGDYSYPPVTEIIFDVPESTQASSTDEDGSE